MMADVEGKHGKVRKNDWQDVRVCYRCGVLFLPMAKSNGGEHERDTGCPRCDEQVTVHVDWGSTGAFDDEPQGDQGGEAK